MEQNETKFFDFTQVEMEVSFDNVMTLDISKTLGNVIHQNTGDLGLDEVARTIYKEGKADIPVQYIPAIVETQKKLLDTVCRYVKPGGTLVYSTCSILPEENHQQVEDFLARHPEYQLVTLPSAMPAEIREKQGENGLQLLPHRDQVEGFFIAKMRRAR